LLGPYTSVYAWFCFGIAWLVGLAWLYRKFRGHPRQYLAYRAEVIDAAKRIDGRLCETGVARLMSCLPGNQILQLEVNEKQLLAPRLPDELDGLSIAHISDLHFTGRIGQPFFDLMVDQANAMGADIIAVTGDLIDLKCCLPWIHETLGRLSAPSGVYCIFGNHDYRQLQLDRLGREIEAAGLHYLGGRWQRASVRGSSVLLAGNELPWISPAADLRSSPEVGGVGRAFRVLLAHTPDQLTWARRGDFDLMLAGHTHGGQIRLPLVGPLIGQSRYGVRYCSGVFYEQPTLLHVSRGVSGLEPIRIHCRPEITRILLRTPRANETRTGSSRSQNHRETCEKPEPACSVDASRR
jgi:hypothetical protein